MREQIVKDIIHLMWLEFPIEKVQQLIQEAYNVRVQAHGIWKIYHNYKGMA